MDAITDWDREYNNRSSIKNADEMLSSWPEISENFRAAAKCEIDIVYGGAPRNKYDLFMPDDTPKGLFIFVHGGYWIRFDKSTSSHLAAGPLAKGWAVAMPSYSLCPDVEIADITIDVAKAIGAAAERVGGPIVLAGHSAGGHLVTRQICEDTNLSSKTLSRIKRVISISGVHDLRPLQNIEHNALLKLNTEKACAESPALLEPKKDIPVDCIVGGSELPEFIRQNDLLANIWRGLGVKTSIYHLEGKNHFDVIDDLENPDGLIAGLLS